MKIMMALFSYGGVEEGTVDSIIKEITRAPQGPHQILYLRFSGDALISRSRSRVLGYFQRERPADVLVMVDHDVEWRGGDLVGLAEQAQEAGTVVAGLYSKRAFGLGWSSQIRTGGAVAFGEEPYKLLETDCVATGFMAIPISVVDKLLEELECDSEKYKSRFKSLIESGSYDEATLLHDMSVGRIKDGAWTETNHDYYDFFRCFRHRARANPAYPVETWQFLSEDWAFTKRINYCGFKTYVSTRPVLVHHGKHGFTIPDGMDAGLRKSLEESDENENAKAAQGQDKKPGGNKKSVRKRR